MRQGGVESKERLLSDAVSDLQIWFRVWKHEDVYRTRGHWSGNSKIEYWALDSRGCSFTGAPGLGAGVRPTLRGNQSEWCSAQSCWINLLDFHSARGVFMVSVLPIWSKRKETDNTQTSYKAVEITRLHLKTSAAEWQYKVIVVRGGEKLCFSLDVILSRPLLIEDIACTLHEIRLFMSRFSVEVRRLETTTAC